MKSILFVILTIAVIAGTIFLDSNSVEANPQADKYTIVIHGGAGTISKSLPDSVKEGYFKSLEAALSAGKKMLKENAAALDVVEAVVKILEDDPHFNAGRGAVYTNAGTHELDASIMDGRDLSNGAVAIVRRIKNPISAARMVMEKTDHVLLAGDGADEFANTIGLEMVENTYFNTPRRYEQWKSSVEKDKKGTVGCVVLDKHGNLAAATSTGGRGNKMVGRVGDSPLINAGTYANNKTCAVSGTGTGELFITYTIAYQISALMEFKGMSLQQAADQIIHKTLKPGDGGIIAVDKDGNYSMTFNSTGMFRGVAASDGKFEVKIWE